MVKYRRKCVMFRATQGLSDNNFHFQTPKQQTFEVLRREKKRKKEKISAFV